MGASKHARRYNPTGLTEIAAEMFDSRSVESRQPVNHDPHNEEMQANP